MVEVEQRRLGSLEEHMRAVAQRTVDEQRDVADVRRETLGEGRGALPDLFQVERRHLVDLREPDVLLGERDLQLLAEDLRVEDVLDADADPRGLVGVRRADSAPGRPDLQGAEPSLRRLIDCDVPRHDQVRVSRNDDDRGVDAPRRELVELVEQHLRIDDAPRADHRRLARDHTARRLPDLERLAAGDDRVPCVRAALVAADDL